jgi:hypothetical protein
MQTKQLARKQRGGAIGTIIFIALLGAGLYYGYTFFVAKPQAPLSCKAQLSACSVSCRRTATEAPAMQACQEACQRDAATCKD